ncbi:hypothetical protein [Cellulomonas massiliensis]|uniref:hypothetical protein n=1 Tax=Cellulomonas massiliensis TaxID=1465811 RepID=UPI0004745027|nr:hypothetical protein [Cellulomonas massiliensis]
MRFNPPPSWPTPPAGWTPPEGWQPDASWPEPPPGWQLWLPDEEPAGGGWPPAEVWVGFAIFVAGAVSLVVSSGAKGGFIWTGGLIFGVVLVVRGLLRQRAQSGTTRAPLAAVAKGAVAVAAVVAIGVGGYAATKFVEAESLTATAGSCWNEEDGQALLVACSGAHQYKAVSEVATQEDCPLTAVASVDSDHAGRVLCIEED